jgi:hypothetical protein
MSALEQLQRSIVEKLNSGELNLPLDRSGSGIKPGAQSAHLDWRYSVKDLLSLLGVDNTLAARKKLATELGYQGPLDGSAEMNIWLHKAVLKEMADSGCEVPPTLVE